MKYERELFNLIEADGEGLGGDLHIIHFSDPRESEERFRVYHKSGHCWDVAREFICEPSEIQEYAEYEPEPDGFAYRFIAEWEGFQHVNDTRHAIRLFKQWTNH